MRHALLTLTSILLLPMVAFGQWEFDSVWPPVEERQFSSAHGIAVDPDGKVWMQPWGPTDSVQVAALDDSWQPVRVLYVFNADGTEADFSPIKFVNLPGGETDTLGGRVVVDGSGVKSWYSQAGVGLRADHNGNILVSADGSPGVEEESGLIYRLNYKTGEGMDKATFEARAPTAPSVDENGNVYITDVFPGDPVLVFDEDLNFLENAIDETVGFSRGFEVSADGESIYWAGFTNNAVILYERPDPFSPYDSIGVVIPGVDSESMVRHPTTGNLWVSAGSTNDRPNDFEGFDTNWDILTWYAFDPAELEVNTVPTPVDSLSWTPQTEADTTGRPRAIAFSPDGNTAYIGNFSQGAPSVQKLVRSGVTPSIEKVTDDIPQSFTLKQNYPNPFNPSTRIEFELHKSAEATLKVYDVLGREVAVLVDAPLGAGVYAYTFGAADLPSGTYMYTLTAGGERQSSTMILAK